VAGVDVGTAYLTIVPSAKGFAGKLQSELGGGMAAAGSKAGDAASKGFGTKFKAGIGTAAKAGALALAGAAALGIGFAKSSIAEARESQKVGALTENVIKSTGGAAKVTAAQVGDLATAISNKTGIDDEAIQSGANMLLTFKNIRNEAGKGNDIFNQSTSILTDLATAMGSDPQKAAIQLGKALNDPIKGVAALGRVGVTFDAQQKKTIKSLVEGGKTAEAQKIILKELNSEFGGAAEASATMGEKMSTAFGNFKEGIGTSLLPVLDKVEGFITTQLLPGLEVFISFLKGNDTGVDGPFRNMAVAGELAHKVISNIYGGLKVFFSFLKGNDTGVDGPFRNMAVAGEATRKALIAAKDAVTKFVTEFKSGEGAGGKFRDVLTTVATAAMAVAGWISRNTDVVIPLVAAVLAGVAAFRVITAVARAYAAVQALLNVVLSANPIGIVIIAIAALAAGLFVAYKKSETFRNIVKGAFEAISAAARFMWNNVVAPVIRFLLDAFTKVTSFYAALLRGLSQIPGFGWAKGAADKLQNVANKAAGIKDAIHDIPDHKTVNVDVNFRPQQGRIRVGSESVNVGMRASGGPVTKGQPYIVGEKRPELFVPDQNGTIVPRVPNGAGGSGGGGLSQSDINRLAAAMSQVQLRTTVSAGSFDSAMARAL